MRGRAPLAALWLAMATGATALPAGAAEASVTLRPQVEWDFDDGEQGFTSEQSGWRTWNHRFYSDSEFIGPGFSNSARDGIWSSNTPSNANSYPTGVKIRLVSPEIEIPPDQVVVVEVWHHYDTQAGGSGGQVLFQLGEQSIPLAPAGGYPGTLAIGGAPTGAFTGQSGGWVKSYFDLKPVQARSVGSALGKLNLYFQSNTTPGGTGWNVERIILYYGDAIPPVVKVLEAPADTDRFDLSYGIRASVVENDAVDSAWIEWAADGPGGSLEGEVPLTQGADGQWRGSIPAQPPGSLVEWVALAEDRGGNQGVDPPEGQDPYTFTVDILPPGRPSLTDSSLRLSREIDLQWAAPDTALAIDRYRIYRGDLAGSPDANQGAALEGERLVGEVFSDDALVQGAVDLEEGSGDAFAVSAVYEDRGGELWESALSPARVVDVRVPSLEGISPGSAYQGQAQAVEIRGEHSDFSQGQVSLGVGEGITVAAVDVVNVRLLRATLQIDPQAAPGERIFTVAVDGAWRGEVPFTVLPASERPVIAGITPRTGRQGETLEVKFLGRNTDFRDDPPTVDFGAGILVTGEVSVDEDGTSFSVPILVEPRADVGARSVLIASGDRVFTDIPFQVLTGSTSASTGCSTPAGRPGQLALVTWMMLALAGWGRRIRRR